MRIEEQLHVYARQIALTLNKPVKKQLRFNDIVSYSLMFYNDPFVGTKELVESCDEDCSLFIRKEPMGETLSKGYRWMVHG